MAYCFSRGRVAAALLLSTGLVACSTEALVPPASIDGATRVGSIQQQSAPLRPAPARSVMAVPLNSTVEPYVAPQSGAASGAANAALVAPDGGVNMDEGLGVADNGNQHFVGLAEEQDADIAEGATRQPVVGGVGTDHPVSLRAGTGAPPRYLGQVSTGPAMTQAPSLPSAPHSLPAELTGRQVAMLRPDNPIMRDAPPVSMAPALMPVAEQNCRAQLQRIGVSFREIPRIDGGENCGIAYPIKITGLPGGIGVNETTLNCQVTLAFAQWVKQEVVPAARTRYFSGVRKIQTMGGYSCRKMNSRANNPWSEHAHGNAIDIGTIVLNNGKEIDVRKKGFFAFREKGLLKTVRSDSCKYFSTVLGPGSDPDHWNHFHLDLRNRKSGYRHCD